MNKILLASGLMIVSGFSAAEELGKVISSTPVTREVVQQNQCAPDAGPRDACRTATRASKQTVGYKVVYEYAGKRYTTQMAEKPGSTVNLQITPTSTTRATKQSSAAAVIATEPIYEDRWDADRDRLYRVARSSDGWDADRDRPYNNSRYDDGWDTYRDRGYTESYSVQPRYTERVYVQPNYYPYSSNYYSSYPSYYGSSYLPLLGLAVGYSQGFRGYSGHYGHRNHYGNHGNYGHRGHHRHGWR